MYSGMSNSSSINIDEAKLKLKSFLPIKKLQELDNALIENVYLQSLIRVKSNNMISRDSSMAENVKLIQTVRGVGYVLKTEN